MIRGRSFTPAVANLLRQSFQRDARALGKLRLALLHLAVLRNALGLVAIRNHQERVAGVGHRLQAENFDRGGWAGFFERAPTIVEHGANLAERVAHNVAVVQPQGSVLHQHGGHRAAPAIELGFDDRAHSLASRRRLGRA
jgi:hypothetical protein